MNALDLVTGQLRRCSIDNGVTQEPPKASLKDLVRPVFFEPNSDPLTLPLTLLPGCTSSIAKFKEQYASHICLITSQSWHKLCDDLGDKMKEPVENNTPSLEVFRDKANEFVNQIASSIGQLLDFKEPTWDSCGTIGYKSDVDLTIQASSLEEAVWYKIIRDLVHEHIFGGKSGSGLDTECFIPHAAEFDLSRFLCHDEQSRHFQTGELAAVALQACMSLGHNPPLYAHYKEQDLASMEENERRVMEKLYAQAEACMRAISATNPTQLLLTLAEAYTRLEQKVHRSTDRETINTCHLEQQRCLLVISALQKGGTVSVAEGKTTLLQAGGQKSALEKKKRTQSLTDYDNGNPEAIQQIESRVGRKFSAPITGQLASSRRNSISTEIAWRVYGDEIERYLRPKYEKPDAKTKLIAAYEESWQLIHIITEGLKTTKEPSTVIIEAGKYADRMMRNLVGALVEFIPSAALTERAKALEQKCHSLEVCKRALRINTHAATILVKEAICQSHTSRGSLDHIELETKLTQMFSKFDHTPTDEDKIIIPKHHLDSLIETLKQTKGIWVDPHDEKILPILQGHAGIEVPKIWHEEARRATILLFELTTEENVLAFLNELLKVGQDARNWARKHGHLTSSEEMATFYDFVNCKLV